MYRSLWGEEGSALLTSLILSLLLISGIMWWVVWSNSRVVGQAHGLATQTALSYADMGVNMALQQLKSPKLLTDILPAQSSTTLPSVSMPNGRYVVDLYRRSLNSDLVEAFSTGYYYLPRGAFLDPTTGTPAQMAVIDVKVRVTNGSQYLAAVPGTLALDTGVQISSSGIVYANNLMFQCYAPNPCDGSQNGQIGPSYYFTNYSFSPSTPPLYMTFLQGLPQRLPYAPTLPILATMVNYYQGKAGSGTLPPFSGTVGPPANSNVYFYSGSTPLDIAPTAPLTVQGVYVIFATTSVVIHNNIVPADGNSWIGILSVGDIHLGSDAPSVCNISANLNADGGIFADSPSTPRPGGNQLNFYGGMVAHTGIQIYPAWNTRSYNYVAFPAGNLCLPNLADVLQYTVLQGQYYVQ